MPSDRVLVVLKGFLGDAVMATPLIDGLFAEGKQVALLTTPTVRDLLRAPNRPFEFVQDTKSRKVLDTFKAASAIRRGKYRTALIVNRSLRSALSVWFAGVRVRSGHATDNRALLLKHKLAYDPERNEAECYLDLGRAVGLNLPFVPPALHVTEEEKTAGLRFLDGATVAVQPGASFWGKRPPIPLLVRLIDELVAKGFKVALIGGNDELVARDELLAQLKAPVVDLVGKTKIRESLGVLADLKLVVGGDTGLMHLAAGVGAPSFTLFSGNKPVTKWAHDYEPHRFILAPGGDINNLDTDEVIRVAMEMLRRG